MILKPPDKMAFHLKLNQPKELPADGLTSAEFKPWTNHLVNFLQQDVENFRFLKGGKYSSWTAASEDETKKRFTVLADGDEDEAAIDASDRSAAQKNADKVRLLNQRNGQLSKLLQHVVSFVHYTEADDIDENSTSMDWIFSYLRGHYNIEAKGSNLLKITEHTYKSGTSHQVFYKQFRTSFINNLRKAGEIMTHKGGAALTSDEVLSPTFEDAIVLWALEKIDARLPKKVRKDYEHRLTGNTYLIDLQVTIFQSIASMLEDLEKQAQVNALTVAGSEDHSLNALRPNFGNRGYQTQRGGRGGGNQYGKKTYKFCKVCHSAGRPRHIFQNHNIDTCSFTDNRDKKSMFASLRAMNLEEQDEEEDDSWVVDEEDLQKADGEQR